jgi:large subunit ribosomal protein L30
MNIKTVTVRQVRSAIGRHTSHKACLKGLGINKIHRSVTVAATAENMGMIKKVAYLLKVED